MSTYFMVLLEIIKRCLGGIVVSVLATGPKGCSSGLGNGFLRAIKIRSTPSSQMGSKVERSHVIRFYGISLSLLPSTSPEVSGSQVRN
jgi:hypothetical protein